MNIDLNIDNYDFNDLLKMFKIKDYNDKKKMRRCTGKQI